MTLSKAIMSKNALEDWILAVALIFVSLLLKIQGTHQYDIWLHLKYKDWSYFES